MAVRIIFQIVAPIVFVAASAVRAELVPKQGTTPEKVPLSECLAARKRPVKTVGAASGDVGKKA